jgi:hemerythrin
MVGEEPMSILFTPDLAVGVSGIDQQHKEIFRRVDALLEASAKGAGRERLAELLPFLGTYVVQHFADEEKTMREAGYPEYPRHKGLHAAFLAEFTVLQKRYQTEGASTSLTLAVQKKVVEWLVQHIKKEDKAIAAFIKSKKPAMV